MVGTILFGIFFFGALAFIGKLSVEAAEESYKYDANLADYLLPFQD